MKISKLIAMLAVVGAPIAQGADGTWNTTTSGLAWSTPGNWVAGVADGSGSTAFFNTLNISGNITVNLDSPRTIGNLNFADTDITSAGSWILHNSNNATNVLTLAGTTPTITVGALNSSSSVTVSAVIAGTDGLTKAGAGLLILSGANTYSGATLINTGSLRALNGSALGSGAVTVASGARLQLGGGITVSNTINLNGSSALLGNTGANTLSGIVNVQSASTLTMASANDNIVDINNTLNLGSNILTVATVGNSNSFVTISGTINGTGGITKNNSGILNMTANQIGTYSGTTTLNLGTLGIGNNGALGSGNLTFGTNDNPVTIRSTSATAYTLANSLTLAGNAGTNAVFNFGSVSPLLNGNLTFSNTGNIAMGSTSRKFSIYNQTEFDGAFTGTGGITMQTGTGTLVLAGANTYSGATTISAGTLQLGNGGTTGSLSTSSTITNNSNFAINRSNAVSQGVDFSGGVISGTGSFTQAGTGTTTLTAANTYTGATTVNAGTLMVNGSLSTSSAVAVNAAATLGGTGSVGAVTVASTGSLAPGVSAIGTFAATTANMNAGSILKLELNTTTATADLLNVGAFNLALTNNSILQLSLLGTDVVTGSTFTLVDYSTWNGGLFFYGSGVLADDSTITLGLNQYVFSYNGVDGLTSAVTMTAVPEPSTYALLAFGGLALYFLRRKGQAKA